MALGTSCGADAGGGGRTPGAGTSATTGPLDTDLALVRHAISDEESIEAFLSAAIGRFRAERSALHGVLERQRQHVSRLRGVLTNLTPPVTRAHAALPRKATDLPAAIGDLALEARIARSADCQTATAGRLAELLGSLAAAHAVTVLAFEPAAAVATLVPTPEAITSADPLQPCLAAEHAAVFGYALLGGVLSAGVSETPVTEAAVSSYDVHRSQRDSLTDLITAVGATPAAAEAAYDVPFPVAGVPTARRLARYLETRCATVYARATAATTEATRVMTSGILLDCAVRSARWGAEPTAFPGLDRP